MPKFLKVGSWWLNVNQILLVREFEKEQEFTNQQASGVGEWPRCEIHFANDAGHVERKVWQGREAATVLAFVRGNEAA